MAAAPKAKSARLDRESETEKNVHLLEYGKSAAEKITNVIN